MGLKIAIVKTQSAVIYFKGFPPPKIKDSFGSKEGERKQGGKFIYLYYNLYKAKIPQSQHSWTQGELCLEKWRHTQTM